MVYVCRRECQSGSTFSVSEAAMADHEKNQLLDDFYEIEVLEGHLCHITLTYEYKVRFEDFSSDEDMWLPASFFNRVINFQSLSQGRSWCHTTISKQELKASSSTEKPVCTKKCQVNSDKTARKTKEKNKARNKGKPFHSTLLSALILVATHCLCVWARNSHPTHT